MPTLSISSRFRQVTFSPTIFIFGEAAETIWRRVNMVIIKSSLHFTTIVHGSFMFSFKKALSPCNFKCRGDKRLVACWQPVLKFWSPTLNFWSHWRPVSCKFGPCHNNIITIVSASFHQYPNYFTDKVDVFYHDTSMCTFPISAYRTKKSVHKNDKPYTTSK